MSKVGVLKGLRNGRFLQACDELCFCSDSLRWASVIGEQGEPADDHGIKALIQDLAGRQRSTGGALLSIEWYVHRILVASSRGWKRFCDGVRVTHSGR